MQRHMHENDPRSSAQHKNKNLPQGLARANPKELVRHLTYDVDVNLRDIILLSSPLHVEFVRALLDWTRAAGWEKRRPTNEAEIGSMIK